MCPECDKVYHSEAGLKYHLGTVHKSQSPSPRPQSRTPSETPPPTVPQGWDPTLPLPARRAAARACVKLKELTKKEEGTRVRVEVKVQERAVSVEDSASVEGEKSGVDCTALKAELAKNGVVVCPEEVRPNPLPPLSLPPLPLSLPPALPPSLTLSLPPSLLNLSFCRTVRGSFARCVASATT